MNNSEILIYQNPDGHIKIDVRQEKETVWPSQGQMAELFGQGQSTVAEHIANVREEAEFEPNRTCRKFRTVQQNGIRTHSEKFGKEFGKRNPNLEYCFRTPGTLP